MGFGCCPISKRHDVEFVTSELVTTLTQRTVTVPAVDYPHRSDGTIHIAVPKFDLLPETVVTDIPLQEIERLTIYHREQSSEWMFLEVRPINSRLGDICTSR
jgi:hypothetical protein